MAKSQCEPCECRLALSISLNAPADPVLRITGTSKDDIVVVRRDSLQVVASLNGTTRTFPRSDVNSVTVETYRGNDQVTVDGLNSTIVLAAGEDRFTGGFGLHVVQGNEGADTLAGGPSRNALVGGPGNDLIEGGRLSDTLRGDEGDDTLLGGVGGGLDALYGGAGNDLLRGGDGADTLTGDDGADTLLGESSNDDVNAALGDLCDGGEGVDQLLLESVGRVEFGSPRPGDALEGILRIVKFEDLFSGDPVTIDASAAPEGIRMVTIADATMIGSAFDDRITCGRNSIVDAAAGNDTVAVRGAGGAQPALTTVNLGEGNDRLQTFDDAPVSVDGGAGDDLIRGSKLTDTLLGGLGRDTLRGLDGNDRLEGGGGNDSLEGGAGADRLYGQNGNDTLNGGGGNDLLFGGPSSADTIIGGAGDNDRAADDDKDSYSTVEVLLS